MMPTQKTHRINNHAITKLEHTTHRTNNAMN